jgi:hypothetical protein
LELHRRGWTLLGEFERAERVLDALADHSRFAGQLHVAADGVLFG